MPRSTYVSFCESNMKSVLNTEMWHHNLILNSKHLNSDKTKQGNLSIWQHRISIGNDEPSTQRTTQISTGTYKHRGLQPCGLNRPVREAASGIHTRQRRRCNCPGTCSQEKHTFSEFQSQWQEYEKDSGDPSEWAWPADARRRDKRPRRLERPHHRGSRVTTGEPPLTSPLAAEQRKNAMVRRGPSVHDGGFLKQGLEYLGPALSSPWSIMAHRGREFWKDFLSLFANLH